MDSPKISLFYGYKKFNEKNNQIETKYKYTNKENVSWKDYLLYDGNLLGIIGTSLLLLLYITTLIIFSGKCSNGVYFYIWLIGLVIIICPFCWMMRALCSPNIVIDLDQIGILNLKHRHYKEENKLIMKYLPKFIDYLEKQNLEEELKAEVWRKEHPLEEKCRLAMLDNPNYVADLIREVTKLVK